MDINFISNKFIIDDFTSDFDISTDDEGLLYKWAETATKKITPASRKLYKVELLDVENYSAKKPNDFAAVCQVAYNVEFSDKRIEVDRVVEWMSTEIEECDLTITLNCPKCKEPKTNCGCGDTSIGIDVDRLWLQSHPELIVTNKHMIGYSNQIKEGKVNTPPCFELMGRNTNNLKTNLHHIQNCPNDVVVCDVKYEIKNEKIEVNFPSGQILLSYLADETDEQGYRLIPDHPLALEAINYYLLFKWLHKSFYGPKGQYLDRAKMQEAERQWLKYKKAARGALGKLGLDELLAAFNAAFPEVQNIPRVDTTYDVRRNNTRGRR